MFTTYSLEITNDSSLFQDIVVFQQSPDLSKRNVLSLAWLTAPAHPGTKVSFSWQEEYNFIWTQTGVLQPGVNFTAQQTLSANPDGSSRNQAHFDYSQGAYTLSYEAAVATPAPGTLYIKSMPNVPGDLAMIGIGMAGAGTFIQPAAPNFTYEFTSHPEYWVAAGTFTAGDVVDIERMTNACEVEYDGTFSKSLVLNKDNSWS